jgi:hypothetical protein
MFAPDHALTSLLVKRRYPDVPMLPLLISVQLMELLWVALNYAGIERTDVAPVVRSVSDIHLAYMPYSHSIATACGLAVVVGAVLAWSGRPWMARAVAIGIVSHLVLDLATHAPDIALAPGTTLSFGSGLYEHAPVVAFVLEILYGVLCVRFFTGQHRKGGLYAFAIIANLLNLSILSPAVPGPEAWLGGRPLTVVTFILVQIIITLWLVYVLSRPTAP